MSFKRRPPPGNVRRPAIRGLNLRGCMTSKTGRRVQFESQAKHILILRLDQDPTVEDYGSLPEEFRYIDIQGTVRTHVPALKVWRTDGNIEIHDVTSLDQQQNQSQRWREEAMHRICNERGWQYVVHTEQELPNPTESANLIMLFGFRPTMWSNSLIEQRALLTLSNGEPGLLRDLSRQIGEETGIPHSRVVGVLCHLIWHNKIHIDWTKLLFIDAEFASNSTVWLPANEDN